MKEFLVEGDFFFIDIDSVWSDFCKGILVFDVYLVDEVVERFYIFIGLLFELLIIFEFCIKVL